MWLFKKLIVSVVLGVSLLSSLAIWAENKQEPLQVAKLDVVNQLSISAHQVGEDSFLQQVGTSKKKAAVQHKAGVPMSTISFFWIMATGLLFFVVRLAKRRIK